MRKKQYKKEQSKIKLRDKKTSLYKILGKLFTDESVRWNKRERKYTDRGWKDEYGYSGSELEKASINFEGFKISTKKKSHHYKEDVYPSMLCDYLSTENKCYSQLILTIGNRSILNIGNKSEKLTLKRKNMFGIRRDVFRELRSQGSLMQFWNEKGLLEYPEDDNPFYHGSSEYQEYRIDDTFYYRSIVVNGKEYPCSAEELETTPEVDNPQNKGERERKKPKVDLAKAVRFPDNRFWQPYSVTIRLKGYWTGRDFDDKIESLIVMDTLRELTDKHDNLCAFVRYGKNRYTSRDTTNIYIGHNNVRYHKDANSLVSLVKEFQGKARSIGSKIGRLKRMPYNQLKRSLPESLPTEEDFYSILC